jgi:hypothetical protein
MRIGLPGYVWAWAPAAISPSAMAALRSRARLDVKRMSPSFFQRLPDFRRLPDPEKR